MIRTSLGKDHCFKIRHFSFSFLALYPWAFCFALALSGTDTQSNQISNLFAATTKNTTRLVIRLEIAFVLYEF